MSMPATKEVGAHMPPDNAWRSSASRTTTVFRSTKTKRDRFARIDNSVLQHKALSFRARGILAFVLSKPVDWRHSSESLSGESGEGLYAIRGALRELADAGYARLQRVRDARGQVVNRWIFREEPSAENREPVAGSPSPENQETVTLPPSDGLPGAGPPAFGEPESGAPASGKTALYETTVSQTTVSQTTEEERKCVKAHTASWPDDLPDEVAGEIAREERYPVEQVREFYKRLRPVLSTYNVPPLSPEGIDEIRTKLRKERKQRSASPPNVPESHAEPECWKTIIDELPDDDPLKNYRHLSWIALPPPYRERLVKLAASE